MRPQFNVFFMAHAAPVLKMSGRLVQPVASQGEHGHCHEDQDSGSHGVAPSVALAMAETISVQYSQSCIPQTPERFGA